MSGMKIYLAGPLFSEAERNWLRGLKNRIEAFAGSKEKTVEVIFPYDLIDQDEVAALGAKGTVKIFEECRTSLEEADILVAVLDCSQVDDGTAWEIGYFFARKMGKARPVIGIRTDFRRAGENEYSKVNAMIEVACDMIVGSTAELLSILAGLIEE
jgi:nucleoside 2-deoxyribosyltransferase